MAVTLCLGKDKQAVCLGLQFSVESENILSDHLNQSRKMFLFLENYQFYLPKKDEPDEPWSMRPFFTLLKDLSTK